jgi:RimJ/RimL family protein N-acetyltransferase
MDNIKLVPVNVEDSTTLLYLYALLQERPSVANISHKIMPSFVEHSLFVRSNPYREWYSIYCDNDWVGSVYVTHHNEIGIGVLHKYQRKGIASTVIKQILNAHGEYLANINPHNKASIKLFESLGFKHIQNTYRRSK